MSTTPNGSIPGPILPLPAQLAQHAEVSGPASRTDAHLSHPYLSHIDGMSTVDGAGKLDPASGPVDLDLEAQRAFSAASSDAGTACGKDDDAEPTYPEGGAQAWLVVFGAWCAMVVGLGLVNTIGPIQAYVATHQLEGYSEGTVSWIFSLYVFLVFFCGLQIGPIFDAKGPRLLIFSGSILCVLCMMLLGLCTVYWHFIIVFSIIGGVGSSLLFTPAIASISHYFNRRRAAATGLATTGGAIGGVVFPLALQSLIPQVGFEWSTRIIGFIFLALCVAANLLVRSRLPPRKSGLGSSVLPDLRIFFDGTGALALVTAGTFFMEFGLFVPISYLTSYCLENGVSEAFSYQIIAVMSAGSVAGRYFPGLLADRFGRFNIMVATLSFCLLTVLGLWLPANYSGAVVPMVVVYAVLFGFASGSNISLVPTCVGQLCETSQYGRYYATCYTVVSFATLTGLPIAGKLIETAGGKYFGLIIFTGCSYCCSLACYVAVRVRKVGWRLNVIY